MGVYHGDGACSIHGTDRLDGDMVPCAGYTTSGRCISADGAFDPTAAPHDAPENSLPGTHVRMIRFFILFGISLVCKYFEGW